MIYFITARDLNMVKIGYAKKPQARFVAIQSHCPVELRLERVTEGSKEQEVELHEQFADARERGEWFAITPAIEAHMATLEKYVWLHRGWHHEARRVRLTQGAAA